MPNKCRISSPSVFRLGLRHCRWPIPSFSRLSLSVSRYLMWLHQQKFETDVTKCTGFIGPAACLVATGFVECSKAGAVSLIIIGVALSGVSYAGWAVNHLDLAPPYAGLYSHISSYLPVGVYTFCVHCLKKRTPFYILDNSLKPNRFQSFLAYNIPKKFHIRKL